MQMCRYADVQMSDARTSDVQMCRCRTRGYQMCRCADVGRADIRCADVHMSDARTSDVQMGICRTRGYQMCRCAYVGRADIRCETILKPIQSSAHLKSTHLHISSSSPVILRIAFFIEVITVVFGGMGKHPVGYVKFHNFTIINVHP